MHAPFMHLAPWFLNFRTWSSLPRPPWLPSSLKPWPQGHYHPLPVGRLPTPVPPPSLRSQQRLHIFWANRLGRKWSIPAAAQLSISCESAPAVTATMHNRCSLPPCSSCIRILQVASSPSITGMWQSMSTMSYASSPTAATACSPFSTRR